MSTFDEGFIRWHGADSLCEVGDHRPFAVVKRQTGFEGLRHVRIFHCDYDARQYRRELFNELGIRFPSSLSAAVNKRQAEYLAGRYTAALAIRSMGIDCVDVPVAADRSPVWPPAVVASITHTNHQAMCAIAECRHHARLGVDAECWLPADVVGQVRREVIDDDEERVIRGCNMAYDKVFTLTFSAKESLFKALYPEVKRYFDFSAAKLTGISIEQGQFELTLQQDLSCQLRAGTSYKGHYRVGLWSVETVVAG